jgi:hypothetical protein
MSDDPAMTLPFLDLYVVNALQSIQLASRRLVVNYGSLKNLVGRRLDEDRRCGKIQLWRD